MIEANEEEVVEKYDLDKPFDKQKEVIYHCSQHSDVGVIVNPSSRQTGKSWTMNAVIHQISQEAPNLSILYVSYNDWQVDQFYKKFIAGCKDTGIIKSTTGSPGKHSVIFHNNSKVEFKSSLSEIRSLTVNALLVDEFAYVSNDFFNETLLPMCSTERPDFKTKIYLASSTRGKSNHLYKMYLLGLDPKFPDYHSVHFSIYDNPRHSKKFIQIQQQLLSPAQFDQEVLGLFVEGGSLVNNVDECAVIPFNLEPQPGVNYTLGCDIGLSKDFSAYMITATKRKENNTDPEVVQLVAYYKEYRQTAPEIEEFIYQLNKKWNFKLILVESNSSGLPIVQHLKETKRMNNVEGFITSNVSKSEIVNRMCHLFDRKAIEIINKDDLKTELLDFSASLTKNNKVTFGNSKHDDLVMGLCISLEAWSRKKNSGNYSLKVL